MAGLRERKKQRTRDALVRTAHELFVAQGYERTTIDEIAAAVDVSQRTFFRYFASKEEVAFALLRTVEERFFTAVRERPADEAPLQVLGNALGTAWNHIGDAIQEVVPLEVYMRMWRVIETTPALVAAHLRHSTEQEERLAAEIARRAGVDPEHDPRPRVLVAAFAGVLQLAGRRWAAGRDITVEGARRVFREHLDRFGPALAEDWRPAGGSGEDTPACRG
ncbi:TetR/AcrR family transcriptional regulator [Streptomyces radiopugnans]|uniref:Transcriptional regulator, TetR family n=1 Tax=Streptomyces radiopugnans TaxID=403935 RepID=A0A1H8ZBI9_9ACTN|nr:TetR family transcriptional regulator [Streptomyces radiopugnans]SEP61780.1 transcriptional regulator, TetR family [Streptomyces radiopugnans]